MPITRLDDALPVRKFAALIPETAPFSVSVLAPIVSVPAVITNASVMVGLPVRLKSEGWLSSSLPIVAADIVADSPFMVMPPAPVAAPFPVMLPSSVILLPPSASVPAVSASVALMLSLLPSVTVPSLPLSVRVATLLLTPGLLWLKYSVPKSCVAVMVMLDASLPVRKREPFMPATVPASVSVLPPITNEPALNVSAPVISVLPVSVKPAALSSVRFSSVAPDMVAADPVSVMPPAPVSLPAPNIFFATDIALPPSVSMPSLMVKSPKTFSSVFSVTPFALLMVRLLKSGLPSIVCAFLPLNTAVPVNRLLPVATVKLPPK